jgi:hypothetical protein
VKFAGKRMPQNSTPNLQVLQNSTTPPFSIILERVARSIPKISDVFFLFPPFSLSTFLTHIFFLTLLIYLMIWQLGYHFGKVSAGTEIEIS